MFDFSHPVVSIALGRSGGVQHAPAKFASTLGSVSVVIPCYKYGHYLPNAVAAAFDQPGLDVEIIIVDDCSPDTSADVADEIAKADPRVSVIKHRSNRGHIATYNDGLDAATGDFVALVSADDLLTPAALSRSAALLTAHPEVGFCYGRAAHFTGSPPRPRLDVDGWITWEGRKWIADRCRAGHNVIASPEVLMRTSVVRSIGGYRADLPHSGDLEMWMRAASFADVGYVRGPDQALYRQHVANMHKDLFLSGKVGGNLVDIEHRWAAFSAIFSGPGKNLPDATEMERTARQTLASEATSMVRRSYQRGRPAENAAELLNFAQALWPATDAELGAFVAGSPAPRILTKLQGVGSSVAARMRSKKQWWRLNQVGV